MKDADLNLRFSLFSEIANKSPCALFNETIEDETQYLWFRMIFSAMH